ncbi:hypothetical protein J6500_08225 [Bradyrhizobium sp. WSM 1704]|nr:hypothetical protein [Bradyrhizobium semiaridum]
MHGSFDQRQQDQQHNYQSFSIKLIALPVLVIVAVIAVLVSRPAAVKWISDAAQAEFVGTDPVPDVAPPAQIAQRATKSGR